MSWFADVILSESVCDECKRAKELEMIENDYLPAELISIKKDIVANNSINDQIKVVQNYDKNEQIRFYTSIYNAYAKKGNVSINELSMLEDLQSRLSLSSQEIQYEDRILPYSYANTIRIEEKLPVVGIPAGIQVITRKDEIIHFICQAILKEVWTTGQRWEGSSQGVSFPIFEGFNFQIGSTKGHIIKEEKLMETSRGLLMVTNQRLFLHPLGENKPLSILLDKILSYNCFSNGIQVYKEGREQGYFLSMERNSCVEIVGLCLGYLFWKK